MHLRRHSIDWLEPCRVVYHQGMKNVCVVVVIP